MISCLFSKYEVCSTLWVINAYWSVSVMFYVCDDVKPTLKLALWLCRVWPVFSSTWVFIMTVTREKSDDWSLSLFLLLSPPFHPPPGDSPPSFPPLPLSSLASSVLLKEAGACYRCLTQRSHFPSSPSSLHRSLPLIDSNRSWYVCSVWTAFDCVLNQRVTNCSHRRPFILHSRFHGAHAASPCF